MNRTTFAIYLFLLLFISIPITFFSESLDLYFGTSQIYDSFYGNRYTVIDVAFSFLWVMSAIIVLTARTINAGYKPMIVVAVPINISIMSLGLLIAPVVIYFIAITIVMLFIPPRLVLRRVHAQNSVIDIISYLERANKLKDSGAISEEDYMLIKNRIIRES